ncbi:MAG TPA: response regulator [Candidatus Pacearchaeota archaeon]|nr:response regulator [Candidatus Pacearchaeota archaeon]
MENEGRILYADDEPCMRRLIELVLRSDFPTYKLEIFSNGSELEKRLKQGSDGISLVLTDNNMPGIKGSDIIRKYSKTDPFKEVPFIIFTAEEDVGERSTEEGAFAYLPKPFPLAGLNSVIRRALSHYEN